MAKHPAGAQQQAGGWSQLQLPRPLPPTRSLRLRMRARPRSGVDDERTGWPPEIRELPLQRPSPLPRPLPPTRSLLLSLRLKPNSCRPCTRERLAWPSEVTTPVAPTEANLLTRGTSGKPGVPLGARRRRAVGASSTAACRRCLVPPRAQPLLPPVTKQRERRSLSNLTTGEEHGRRATGKQQRLLSACHGLKKS